MFERAVVVDVEAWLRGLGLGHYVQAFAENGVDLGLLPELTNEDLKDLGVERLVDRKSILKAIARLSETEGKSLADPSALAAMKGEHRQVTVMFADLAGFTGISRELGAEPAHALLNRFFEIVDGVIEGYGGSIDKHIGDNVMATFGAPFAHSDDPQRAARAALDIHQAMTRLSEEFKRPLLAHIGLASGQVVASRTGSEAHREYTVTGSSVNLASRLQDRATGGETLVSRSVQRAVSELAECIPVGEIEVKGFDAPVPVWRLERFRVTVARRSPFVGRCTERRQFSALIKDCLKAGAGQAILVRGEAGIGKSRLIDEFESLAEAQGFSTHKLLIFDFGVGRNRDAVRTLVHSLLGLAGDCGSSDREEAADRAVEVGRLGAEARVFLNDLLDLPQPSELRALYHAMDNATRQAGQRAAVAHLIRRESAERPILVAVEDVHWADMPMLAHLAGIAATVADCRAVMVMTSRVEGDPLDQAWRASLSGSPLTTIDLQPLRLSEAQELAGGIIETGSAFIQHCIARADGNPLFLEQLLRDAREGTLTEVPGSIQSLVLARMDNLRLRDRRALQAASALGQRFALDALRALLEDKQYNCAALVEHRLVWPDVDHDFLFAHALIQEGAYSSLLQAQKRRLHRRAAEWFRNHDSLLYAEHLDRAEDPKAPQALLEAARMLSFDHRFEKARQLAERGSKLAADTETEFELACLTGETSRELGIIEDSIAAFEHALDVAADDETMQTRAWIGLAAGTRLAERYTDALEALDKAQRAARDCDLIESLADIHYQRAGLLFRLGDIDECLTQGELALKFARQAASAEHEARALSVLGDAYYMRGRMITAHDHYCRCLEQARQNGFGRIEVANRHLRGLTRYFQNDLEGALEDGRAAVQAASTTGHHRAEMIARGIVAGLLLDMGDFGGAEEHFSIALTLAQRLGARSYEPFSLVGLGKIHLFRGDRSGGLSLVEEAVVISREGRPETSGPRALGALALLTDDPDTRSRALREGEEALRGGCISHHHFSFYRDAMETCLHEGDWERVERYAAALESYTRAEPLPLAELLTARGRALAAWSRGGGGEALLRELRRLHAEAAQVGLEILLPALEAALRAA